MFQWGVVFKMGPSFLSGRHPMEGIDFGGGGFKKKIVKWRGGGAGVPPHYGKPCQLFWKGASQVLFIKIITIISYSYITAIFLWLFLKLAKT